MSKVYDKIAEHWIQLDKQGKLLVSSCIEKPAFRKLIKNVKGKDALSLGCGIGNECIELQKSGFDYVDGIDSSEEMLKYAKENNSAQGIVYKTKDIKSWTGEREKYDLICSLMSLHYIKDWDNLLSKIFKSLKKEGTFIFSVVHPLKYASESVRNPKTKFTERILGYSHALGEN